MKTNTIIKIQFSEDIYEHFVKVGRYVTDTNAIVSGAETIQLTTPPLKNRMAITHPKGSHREAFKLAVSERENRIADTIEFHFEGEMQELTPVIIQRCKDALTVLGLAQKINVFNAKAIVEIHSIKSYVYEPALVAGSLPF